MALSNATTVGAASPPPGWYRALERQRHVPPAGEDLLGSRRPAEAGAGPAAQSASAPILRLLLAFGLSVPLLALSMLAGPARPEAAASWAGASWAVCGALAGWNGLEYALGRAAHGGATPAWLRWVLAVPYVAVSWVAVRTVAAMVAGLAYLASAG